MKLSPADYERYYQTLGIHESDLLSPRDVELTELPADVVLSDEERRSVGAFLPKWNRMDARMKIDAARAAERHAFKSRAPDHLKRLEAWTAYLLLGGSAATRSGGSSWQSSRAAKWPFPRRNLGSALVFLPRPRSRVSGTSAMSSTRVCG